MSMGNLQEGYLYMSIMLLQKSLNDRLHYPALGHYFFIAEGDCYLSALYYVERTVLR